MGPPYLCSFHLSQADRILGRGAGYGIGLGEEKERRGRDRGGREVMPPQPWPNLEECLFPPLSLLCPPTSHTHTHTHTNRHIHIQTFSHTHMLTHTQTPSHTHSHTLTQALSHSLQKADQVKERTHLPCPSLLQGTLSPHLPHPGKDGEDREE